MAAIANVGTVNDQLWSLIGQEDLELIPQIYHTLDEAKLSWTDITSFLENIHTIEHTQPSGIRLELVRVANYVVHLVAVRFIEQIPLTLLATACQNMPQFSEQFLKLRSFKHLLTVANECSMVRIGDEHTRLYQSAFQAGKGLTSESLKTIYITAWSKIKAIFNESINLTLPDLIVGTHSTSPYPYFRSYSWEALCDVLIAGGPHTAIRAIAFPPFQINDAQLAYFKKSLAGKTIEEAYLMVDQFSFTPQGIETLKQISLEHNVKKWNLKGLPDQYVQSIREFCTQQKIEFAT